MSSYGPVSWLCGAVPIRSIRTTIQCCPRRNVCLSVCRCVVLSSASRSSDQLLYPANVTRSSSIKTVMQATVTVNSQKVAFSTIPDVFVGGINVFRHDNIHTKHILATGGGRSNIVHFVEVVLITNSRICSKR